MKRLSIVLVCLFFSGLHAFGQQAMVDSLLQVLNSTKRTIDRVELLCEISSASYNYDVVQGHLYAEKACEEAKSIDYKKGLRHALILNGFYHQDVGEYTAALQLYREAYSLPIPDDDFLAYGYVMTGNLYRVIAKYDSSAYFYSKALNVLNQIHSDEYLAYTYKSMSRLYMIQWKNKEAEESLNKAIALYERKSSTRNVADAGFLLSKVYRNLTEYTTASEYIDKSCVVAQALNDDFLQLQCLINDGELKTNKGEYTDALNLFFKALKMLEQKNVPSLSLTVYYNIGAVYEEQGQNDLALRYFFEALKISEKLADKHECAKILSSVSWIYKNQFNFRLAHEYIDKSLALRQEIKDEHGISNCYNVLGLIYFQESKYSLALEYLEKSLAIRKRINHRQGVSATLFNLGLVYEGQKNYKEALRYQQEALAMDESIGNKFGLGVSYNSIGSLYTTLGNLTTASDYLTKAQRIGEEIQSKTLLMNNKFYWSKYYEAKGDFKKALAEHQEYSSLNDSLYSENSAGRLAELQALYQVEKKDQEIVMLNQQRELQKNKIDIQESQISLQNTVILFVITGIILISILAIKTNRYNRQIRKANRSITEQKEEIQAQSEELTEANQRLVKLNDELIEKTEEIQAQSEELRETNEMIVEINQDLDETVSRRTAQLNEAYKELDTFFYRSSHDFRRPLTTFMGLAEVANVTVKDQNALELFDKVRETAKSLDKMLIKLQSISDVGTQQLVYKEVLIEEIFLNICDDFREELLAKGIKTSYEVTLQESLVSYPAMIRIIFENLVENAINFSTPLNPFIHLHVYQEGDQCVMTMEDNGQGILKEYQERVFEMYFRGSDRSKGNGLGLYIVRKAIEKLNGTIRLETNLHVGSKFIIRLPISYQESMLSSRFKI
jgi:signal transduction histidine kinase